jgi:PAS domain-containing protein
LSLLAQSPLGPLGGTAIRSDYTQPFSEGVLGLSYRTSKPVNMKDRHDGSEAAKAFKQVAPETVSELCIPITLRGRILWILNLEDSRRNAFADREIDTLKNIVDQVDKVVDHLFEGQVLNQVLDEFPDGVVIARKGGGVLRCNNEAQRIFELDSAVPDAPLSSFLAPDDLAIALSEQNSPPWKTQVRGTRGKETPVLISKFLLPDEYDHVVLQLQDTTELQWKSDIERLNAALADAASQVRVPLSLVSSYVQQIGRKANDGVLADLVAKTARQLSRIELTYDRVFASYDANKLPNERKIPVEINRILAHILGELSASDRAAVKVACGEAAIWVLADSYRLLFALESMLTYLLHCRANSNEITVDVASVNKKYAEIVMAGSVSTIEPNGALEKIVEATRMEIALGERLLKQIGTECGGAFERRQQPGREQLLLRLKLKP